MKNTFQEADERWERMKQNGKNRNIRDSILSSFDKLGQNDQDEIFKELFESQRICDLERQIEEENLTGV